MSDSSLADALKPYPAYKDSSLHWLGRVPEHWTEQRAKYFFREVDERSTTGEEELLSVSHVTGVTPRKQNVTMFMAESNVGHKVCRPGDLVINTMWAFMAALGVAKQIGVVSPSYGVYRPRASGCLLPGFVDHLLRVDAYKSEYLCRSTGIRASRLRLYPEQFLRIPILCPPPDEQSLIIRFLGHLDRRVRRYIHAKRRIIDLLNEQRQAIIHRAVTRGLDPNVRLKPSGVEWLGNVPEHWTPAKLATRFYQCLGKMVDAKRFTGDHAIPYLRNIDVQWDHINTSNLPVIDIAPHERERFTAQRGDLLVCEGDVRSGAVNCLYAGSRRPSTDCGQ
jgi:type I restriction enzyme S subunit